MTTIVEKDHAGDCPICRAEVHAEALVCRACGAEKVTVDNGPGGAAVLASAVGILLVIAGGACSLFSLAIDHQLMALFSLFSSLGILAFGIWLRWQKAKELAEGNRRRTAREAWRHVSAHDAMVASERAETAANSARDAADRARSTAERAASAAKAAETAASFKDRS